MSVRHACGEGITRACVARRARRARRAFGLAFAFAFGATFAMTALACTPERVEYRRRPDFGMPEDAAGEFIAADGTRVVWVDEHGNPVGKGSGSAAADGAPKGPRPPGDELFEPRKVADDGTVTVRCLLPEHVVANTMTCFRNEEWKVLWDQLLAPESKAAYERKDGGGYAAFEAWCIKNRKPAMELLNRMRFNAMGSDVTMRPMGPGQFRATVSPRLWDQFSLRVLEIEQADGWLKLRSIRANP
jgi:hypothetical protein